MFKEARHRRVITAEGMVQAAVVLPELHIPEGAVKAVPASGGGSSVAAVSSACRWGWQHLVLRVRRVLAWLYCHRRHPRAAQGCHYRLHSISNCSKYNRSIGRGHTQVVSHPERGDSAPCPLPAEPEVNSHQGLTLTTVAEQLRSPQRGVLFGCHDNTIAGTPRRRCVQNQYRRD